MSVEAGLMDMLTRMETGKFKVFSPLLDWFEEFRLYHRKDGKVVKEGDDLAGSHALRRHDAALCRDDLPEAGEVSPSPLDPWLPWLGA